MRLSDNTEISLAPHSIVNVDRDFGRTNRKIYLTGSAFFSVHHSELDFVVDMDGFYVQDIGTRFVIASSANSDTIHVSVKEGKVFAYDTIGSKVIVNANEEISYIRSLTKLRKQAVAGSTGNIHVLPDHLPPSVDSDQTAKNNALTGAQPALRRTAISAGSGQFSDSFKDSLAAGSVKKPARWPTDNLDGVIGDNRTTSACDCDDTPPFKRFEKLDIHALSQAEYDDPDLLVSALTSQNAERRAIAVRRLGKLQSGKYLEAILALIGDKDCVVRSEVISALGNFRSDRIAKELISNIADPACFVREQIAGALKNYKDIAGSEAALITLTRDKSPNVVSEALYSLRAYKDANLANELLSHLQDTDEHVEVAAIYSLSGFSADSIALLLAAKLNNIDKHVRQASAEVLKYYNPKIARPALLAHLQVDTNEHVQLAIIESLVAVGDDSAIGPLTGFVNDNRPVIRQMTIRALGVIGNNKVIQYLQKASHDENPFVRKEADDALKKISKK
ncbi:MAG TPA: HEAT repeat domain-containing protein [Chitinophagaceae bacterium]